MVWVGVQQGQSYFMGRRCIIRLGCHPSSDDIPIKLLYGVDVILHFSTGLVKTNSDFIVGSVETT